MGAEIVGKASFYIGSPTPYFPAIMCAAGNEAQLIKRGSRKRAVVGRILCLIGVEYTVPGITPILDNQQSKLEAVNSCYELYL